MDICGTKVIYDFSKGFDIIVHLSGDIDDSKGRRPLASIVWLSTRSYALVFYLGKVNPTISFVVFCASG